MGTSTDLVVIQLDRARQALVQAKTIQETKQVLDISAAAEIYARRQQLGEEAIGYARSIKVEALRQLGGMLKETPRSASRFDEGNKKEPSLNSAPTLSKLGLDKKTSALAQKIAELSDEQFEAVKSGVVALSKTGNVHVSNNSGNNEWYTPPEIIKAARETMGTIDLDPASSAIANNRIEARAFYTAEDSGLIKTWHGNISQACVLVNNATETAWGQQLLKHCDAVLFLAGRVKFLDIQGKANGAPLQGQMVIYFGESAGKFKACFESMGATFVTRANSL